MLSSAPNKGGLDDHIHMLFHLPPDRALSDAMRLLTTNSSRWMNDYGKAFGWQEGYGAFVVSVSNLSKVVRYIHNQEMHHRKMTFEDEYLGLLVSPLPGLAFPLCFPTAYAVGYNMPPPPGAGFRFRLAVLGS